MALELHGVEADADEVECMVANMVFRVRLILAFNVFSRFETDGVCAQGFIKGYISHEKQTVVLAKTNPFPNLHSVPR